MPDPFPASKEHTYFLEIETLFNSLRRSASLLSPADWQVANRWWSCAIPLSLVQSALENVFLKRKERGESRSIQSLRYCESAVDNAFRQLQELGYGEHPHPAKASLSDRLVSMIDELQEFGESHRLEILACGENTDDPAEVELRLASLEKRLSALKFDQLEQCESQRIALDLERRLELATEPLRARLDPATLERTRSRTRHRLLKELMGIPRLSLFVD